MFPNITHCQFGDLRFAWWVFPPTFAPLWVAESTNVCRSTFETTLSCAQVGEHLWELNTFVHRSCWSRRNKTDLVHKRLNQRGYCSCFDGIRPCRRRDWSVGTDQRLEWSNRRKYLCGERLNIVKQPACLIPPKISKFASPFEKVQPASNFAKDSDPMNNVDLNLRWSASIFICSTSP